ncbi:hypothetical protein J0910_06865 [Nocardiopsis sp. CNT-189]|uniref:hypothetical protein n=1 Tax=Nocardiopsis oceanisediminis TaxID=2816862 RepID=UPI003B33957D
MKVPLLDVACIRRHHIHYTVTAETCPAGVATCTAVLKPGREHTGHPRIICAGTPAELAAELAALPAPRLPTRTTGPAA